MSYFQSQGRKYLVRVKLVNADQSEQIIEVPMFSNTALNDVRDIVEDFAEKLDLSPKRYGIDHCKTFKIESMRDRLGRNWIEDSKVYGGIYLETV
jgi:hypothetical protein